MYYVIGLKQLTLGSNSGVVPHGPHSHIGSQAFIFVTKDRVLWRGYSSVIEWPQNPSFHPEAYGMLA